MNFLFKVKFNDTGDGLCPVFWFGRGKTVVFVKYLNTKHCLCFQCPLKLLVFNLKHLSLNHETFHPFSITTSLSGWPGAGTDPS